MTELIRFGRRSTRRWNIIWAGVLLHSDNEYPCTVLDISELGARIAVVSIPARPSLVKLQCPQFGTLDGWLLWSRGETAGIRFHLPPSEVFERLKAVVPGLGRKNPAKLPGAGSTPIRPGFGRVPRTAQGKDCEDE